MRVMGVLGFLVVMTFLSHTVYSESTKGVQLDIAIEDSMVDMTLVGPTKLFMGFGHFPKTKREKRLWQGLRKTWEENYGQLFSLKEDLNCQVLDSSFEIQIEVEEHIMAGQYKTPTDSDVRGSLQLQCEESPIGTTLGLRLKEKFRRIPSIQVDLLTSDGKQETLISTKSTEDLSI